MFRLKNGKEGAQVGSTHLCTSCSSGQCITGYRDAELVVLCTHTSPNFIVPFKVRDCTEYHDKNQPDGTRTKKSTLDFQPLGASKPTGLRGLEPYRPVRYKNAGDLVH